jgi:hypothetical protein
MQGCRHSHRLVGRRVTKHDILGDKANRNKECLSPDDFDGHALLKRAHPDIKFTTGEHEYSRYGFRKLIEGRHLDIIQPDVCTTVNSSTCGEVLIEAIRLCGSAA